MFIMTFIVIFMIAISTAVSTISIINIILVIIYNVTFVIIFTIAITVIFISNITAIIIIVVITTPWPTLPNWCCYARVPVSGPRTVQTLLAFLVRTSTCCCCSLLSSVCFMVSHVDWKKKLIWMFTQHSSCFQKPLTETSLSTVTLETQQTQAQIFYWPWRRGQKSVWNDILNLYTAFSICWQNTARL